MMPLYDPVYTNCLSMEVVGGIGWQRGIKCDIMLKRGSLMYRSLSLMALVASMYIAPARAADSCAAVIPPEAAAKAKNFLDLLVAGKGSDAVSGVIDTSPIWSTKTGAKEQILGQIDAATKAYGPAIKWDAVCGDAFGKMAFREYYIVQHRDIITRWEFDFGLTANGWKVAYFGFTDQIQTFF